MKPDRHCQRILPMIRGVPEADDQFQSGAPGIFTSLQGDQEGNLFVRITGGAGPDPADIRRWMEADDIAEDTFGMQVLAGLHGFNGSPNNGVDRIRCGPNNADAVAPLALGLLENNSYGYGFNGAAFDRLRTASAVDAAATTKTGVQLTSNPVSAIIATSDPGDNTAASAAMPAPGVGSNNIVTGMTVTLVGTAASTIVTATLSDGVTTFWNAKFLILAGDSKQLDIPCLNFAGADNAPMTLSVTAGGAGTQVTACLRGYIVN